MTRLTGAAKASHERKVLLDAARRAITRRDTDSVLYTLALLTAANEVQP